MAAVKKVRGHVRFTVEEIYEVIPEGIRSELDLDTVRGILDEMVDSGELAVVLTEDDELRYRFARARTAEMLVRRINALAPGGSVSERMTEIPYTYALLERARQGEPGFTGLRTVQSTREELVAARDELVGLLRDLNQSTARSQPSNDELREWAASTLRQIRYALRHFVPKTAEPDTLCVTCRTRQRHFGEFCKRCCPEDQRPHGKVT